MIEWLALAFSIIALGVSIKAYLNSGWIDIDWHYKDEDGKE